VLDHYRELQSWAAAVETGSHVLRLVYGGVFDRYPNARIIVGQLGAALPYFLSMFDAQAKREGSRLNRAPSDYLRDNVCVTTTGLNAIAPLYCAIAALGPAQLMFGTGYPFASVKQTGQFLDTVRLDENLRADIAYRNAERILGL
jgi:2,3-dihydroxybenzoate decarboxylase